MKTQKHTLALFYCQNTPGSGEEERQALEEAYGKSIRLLDDFSSKPARAFSPKFLGDDVKPGDTVIVTGYIHRQKMFDRVERKMVEEENVIDVTGIKVMDRMEKIEGIDEFGFSEKVDGARVHWNLAEGKIGK